MKQFLKNYTSNVPVHQTIHRIEQVLIQCGVSGITKEYAPDASVAAITFHIAIADGRPMTIRLPVDTEKAQDALWKDYVGTDKLEPSGEELSWQSKKRKKRSDFSEQAKRTAWKIIQDWIEVQMSMIQMNQAQTDQVFMPYAVMGDGTTFYQAIKRDGFRAMLAEKSSA
jgi:hypothetical protein